MFRSEMYDGLQRQIAEVTDRYADLVYNGDVDQRGYLVRPVRPTRYFYPDEEITSSFERYSDLARPVVVHAPLSPIIKGTKLVRVAVAALTEDGYEFEYIVDQGAERRSQSRPRSRARTSC